MLPAVTRHFWPSLLLLGLLLSASSSLMAQSARPTNLLWMEASGEGKIVGKFYYNVDFQYRRQADASQVPGGSPYNLLKYPSEVVLRPFFTYHVDSSLSVALSPLGWYGKWVPAPNQGLLFTPELRLVPQLTYQHPLGSFRLEHRGRYEFRWGGEQHRVPDGNELDEGYQFAEANKKGRIRYRLTGTLPLGNRRNRASKFAAIAYNELFISVGEQVARAERWDQNRTLLGLEYTLPGDITLEAGYLHQLIFSGGQRTNHILSLSI